MQQQQQLSRVAIYLCVCLRNCSDPPYFYCKWTGEGGTKTSGPYVAKLLPEDPYVGVYIECPPATPGLLSAVSGEQASDVTLSIVHYVPTVADSTFDDDGKKLAYMGVYGGNILAVDASMLASPPPFVTAAMRTRHDSSHAYAPSS